MLTDNAVVCLIFFLLALLFSQPFQLRVPIQFPHLHRVLAPVRHYFHEQAEKNLRYSRLSSSFRACVPMRFSISPLCPMRIFFCESRSTCMVTSIRRSFGVSSNLSTITASACGTSW